ncbi:MAG: hypothetical protein EZS28_006233 [Streblomastix strix]|uniref:Uncharacterized protein n=1 Tax=Streblomastix strix TaxID=222440 RepID=A0A5J4WUJ2_9EUKA|nr:MAG: hypothetical protein EZS28_006233 [Streblomastix strix]
MVFWFHQLIVKKVTLVSEMQNKIVIQEFELEFLLIRITIADEIHLAFEVEQAVMYDPLAARQIRKNDAYFVVNSAC